MNRIRKDLNRGLSLIELVIVLGIFAFVLSGGLFLNTSSFKSYYFQSEEKMLGSLLRGARIRAISNINNISQGLFISDKGFILFQGENYNENSSNNENFPRNKAINIESNFTNQTIVFENLTGNPKQLGEIKIFDDQRESTIKIGPEGRIE